MPELEPPTAQEWRELALIMGGFGYSKALAAACRFDLFTELSERPGQTARELAERLAVPDASMTVLLQALAATGLIHRSTDGGCDNSAVADRALVRGRPDSVLEVIEGYDRILYPGLARLYEALLEGDNVGLEALPGVGPTIYRRLQTEPELERAFHAWVERVSELTAAALDTVDLTGCRRLLDVGGGSGANAIALCRRHPDLEVGILDLDSVCAIATRRAVTAGLAHRIHTVVGDFFEDPFPTGFDTILFSHIFNIHSAEANITLLSKAWDALPWGGQVIIVNSVELQGRPASLGSALLSLYFLAVATGEGRVYPVDAYEGWLGDAGFGEATIRPVPGTDHAVIRAEKTPTLAIEFSTQWEDP